MKKGLIIGLSIVGVVVILLLILYSWIVGGYNNFVSMDEEVKKSWSQVENLYQRRMDLIPNLVNTVKGYANFEQKTLTDVINARSRASQFNITPEVLNDPKAFQKFQQVQGELSGALSRLMVTVENYPQLKANENFLQLQSQLEGTENRIAVERMKFNETAKVYNTAIKQFPKAMIANFFGFREKPYFSALAGADVAPKVEF
ncbi:MAG: LemA family protein [Ignavibacteriaceae bacterium]